MSELRIPEIIGMFALFITCVKLLHSDVHEPGRNEKPFWISACGRTASA